MAPTPRCRLTQHLPTLAVDVMCVNLHRGQSRYFSPCTYPARSSVVLSVQLIFLYLSSQSLEVQMARSLRSSRMQKNKRARRASLYEPVENERIARLSTKLLAVVQDPQIEKKQETDASGASHLLINDYFHHLSCMSHYHANIELRRPRATTRRQANLP